MTMQDTDTEVADHCNLGGIIPFHSCVALIVFTLSVCLSYEIISYCE